MLQISYWIPLLGVVALLFALMKSRWVSKQDPGNETMRRISGYIQQGAMAFLGREYKVLSIFVIVAAVLLFVIYAVSKDASGNSIGSPIIAVSFVVGAFCSALAGYFGMRVATNSNVRTANAARSGLNKALAVAFSGGTVMGMSVVGLGVLGLSLLFIIYSKLFLGIDGTTDFGRVVQAITGFSMGASSIALFARVGGGIYTKAADIGADLVGKVEAGIPEDDPRNPAVIADLVGDNVGDVAGKGADLFLSFVGLIVGPFVLSIAFFTASHAGLAVYFVLLPLIFVCVG
nr:sodium/proton-translocating pyrophosphatase [FCB group bacterium]